MHFLFPNLTTKRILFFFLPFLYILSVFLLYLISFSSVICCPLLFGGWCAAVFCFFNYLLYAFFLLFVLFMHHKLQHLSFFSVWLMSKLWIDVPCTRLVLLWVHIWYILSWCCLVLNHSSMNGIVSVVVVLESP